MIRWLSLSSLTIVLDENWHIVRKLCVQYQYWFLFWFTVKWITRTTKRAVILWKIVVFGNWYRLELPDMDTLRIPIWKYQHMSFRKLDYFRSLWYIVPNLCSFPSNRPPNCLYFEVTDSDHRHILGLGNLSNHLDNWCYTGSLNFYVKYNLPVNFHCTMMFAVGLPLIQSVNIRPHSTRQLVSEQDKVQSM